MGCSSSALGKAGDNSRFRSATSNDCFSTTEESESCVAQPKPCTAGRDSAFYGHSQRGGLPPSEKPKASVMPTANGLAKGVAPTKAAGDQSGPTEKSLPPGGREGAEPRQPGGKGDTSGTEEIKKDVETALEVQSLKGNADMEPSGTAAPGQPLRTAGAGGAGERTEHPQAQTVGLMKPLGTAGELQSQAAMGEDEQCQLPETTPKENRSPEISEGNQLVETVEEQQLQEAVGKDEQAQSQLETIPKENEGPEILEGSQFVETVEELKLQETLEKDAQLQPLEIIPKEDGTSEIQDKSQPVPTPVMDDPIHATPQGPGIPELVQPEGIVGGREHPVGITEPAENMEVDRKSHTSEEEQCTEGETGENVERETENEKVNEAETKEEETGEAVDLSAAT
ncbi:glutamate-rich protein 5 [Heterocephalus glaber]|uniref:Glutamate-rich protein 5 n=1 Tax=Heterocephalus glaber TaxID=10181 RepID=A0AAX6PES3_HETGA|nr:glutamate-rich protein 5 [Heterocephalus glaber]